MAEKDGDELKSGEKSPILPKYYKADMSDGSTGKSKISFTSSNNSCCCRVTVVLAVLLLISAVIGLSVGLGVYYGVTKRDSEESSLAERIKTVELERLLVNLQDTAVNNSRSVLTGYNNSAEYVYATLEENGYEPTRQYFTIPVPEENEGTFSARFTSEDRVLEFNYPQYNQFQIMIYSAGCTVVNDNNCTWNLASLIDDEESEFGCGLVGDSVDGKAVLVPYESAVGNCSIYEKALNVKEAGATAVIFVTNTDSTTPPRNRVFERNDDGTVSYVDIPSIGVTNATGNQLVDLMNLDSDMEVTLELSAKVTIATTYNVIAETKEGRADRVVMIGSHLDSVPAGPGINDDGSGSMTNLLIAIQVAKQEFKPENKIRFAWWGAEELGLLGSRYYVAMLSDEERNDISLKLNFDMLASTNYQRGVYDASSAMDDELLDPLTKIQDLFIEYFNKIKKSHELVPFTGGSDYRPFLDAGIPAGGLFTGAGSIKTEKQWEMFGGIINAPLDPCYHQACDTVTNINYEVYLDMTRAAAYTLQTLAEQRDLESYLQG